MKQHLKTITLQELASLLGVTLRGDPQCSVFGLAKLECATAGQLSFLTHQNYRKFLVCTKASAVILKPEEAEECPVSVLITDNPRLTLAKAAEIFEQEARPLPGIHPTAIIQKGCRIPETVSIGPYCVLGENVVLGERVIIESGTIIGDNCIIQDESHLKPRVTLYNNVTLGTRCLVHSGAVIGSDGFGYAQEEGRWIKMPHLGGVCIGNSAEIGANTTIDRGVLDDTILGDGVIIDNLVQIGHNVVIGDRTAIAGCAAIAGSTHIGKECLIGGGVGIVGHLQIGDKVYITAGSGVNHSLKEAGVYSSGMPAKANALWRKNIARFHHLDEMARRLRALENKVGITVRKMEVE